MAKPAKATFEVKNWDEKTINQVDGRLKITRASVVFAYQGDLAAESAMEYVMAYRDDASATVVGVERITGRLGGKKGTFVVESRGGYADGTFKGDLTVVTREGPYSKVRVGSYPTRTEAAAALPAVRARFRGMPFVVAVRE